MRAAWGFSLLLAGAVLLACVFATPGDQTALAAVGGALVGYGIFLSASGVARWP